MVLCGLGMQQSAMRNATIQKKTFFELGVYGSCDDWKTFAEPITKMFY